jgi:carboxyl-terminal processing protease
VLDIDQLSLPSLLESVAGEEPDGRTRVRAVLLAAGALDGAVGAAASVRAVDQRGRMHQISVRRRAQPGTAVRFGNLPPLHAHLHHRRVRAANGTTVGVISFNIWMPLILRQFDEAIDALRDTDGIVIDLRGNPGGVAAMVMGTSGHFLNERLSLGTMKTRDSELRFVSNPRRVDVTGRRVVPYGGPLAILTDGLTGSTSEMFAGGMQAIGRARVFGETTAGQVLPALSTRLPDGDVLYYAFADFLTANGIRLEGRGVIPDVEVPLSRADLLAGRDAPLDEAIRWIASS